MNKNQNQRSGTSASQRESSQNQTMSMKAQPKVTIQRKQNKTAVTAIIALSVLLGLSVVFGITAAFFSGSANATGTITLGDPVNIDITQGGAAVTTLTFPGTAMPGTVYDQPIGVAMPTGTSDAVVRGKLTITNTDGAAINVNATTDEAWLAGTDDYYYFNGKLSAGETQSFVTQVTVPTTLTNVDSNKTYAIAVQIEAIQFANGAAAEVWTTAPEAWITAYGSGT